MTTEWVLLVAFLSPGGDFMGKKAIVHPNKASCQAEARQWNTNKEAGMPVQFKTLCVTMAHWEGKAQDKGVAFD